MVQEADKSRETRQTLFSSNLSASRTHHAWTWIRNSLKILIRKMTRYDIDRTMKPCDMASTIIVRRVHGPVDDHATHRSVRSVNSHTQTKHESNVTNWRNRSLLVAECRRAAHDTGERAAPEAFSWRKRSRKSLIYKSG